MTAGPTTNRCRFCDPIRKKVIATINIEKRMTASNFNLHLSNVFDSQLRINGLSSVAIGMLHVAAGG